MSPNSIQYPRPPSPTTTEPKSFYPKKFNSIFTFIATFFLSLLQVKSQYDDNLLLFFITALLAIFWLLLYSWAYAACLKPSPQSTTSSSSNLPPPLSSTPTPSFLPSVLSSLTTKSSAEVYHEMMIIFGELTLASLGSLLVPSSAQRYTLYTMYAIIVLAMVLRWSGLPQLIYQATKRNLLPLHTGDIDQRRAQGQVQEAQNFQANKV